MSAQENKITIILIAVVVLFLICQTPSAVNLLYVSWFDAPTDAESQNLQKGKPRLFVIDIILFLFTIIALSRFYRWLLT